MTPAELRTSIETILDGGNAWCKGANARTASGLPCSPRSSDAVEWDLMGAVIKAYEGETNYTSYHTVLKELSDNIPTDYKSRDIEAWNDSVTWSELLDGISHIALQVRAAAGEAVIIDEI